MSKKLYKFNNEKLPENFVAIAAKIISKTPTHAGILIRHKNVNYLHHFPGNSKPEVIENFNEDGWYVYGLVDAISNDVNEVGAFLQFCKRICDKSNITYSYIADGSSYEDRGEFISKIGLPEFGTCVGFCVNTLTNTLIDLEDSYFKLEDWDDSGLDDFIDQWSKLQAEKKYPDLDWTLYNTFKKRITPLEYVCSAFTKAYPIEKEAIEKIKPTIEKKIAALFP